MATDDVVLDIGALSKLSKDDYDKMGIPFCNVKGFDDNLYYSSDESLLNKYNNLNYMLYNGIGFLVGSIIVIIIIFVLLFKNKIISVGLTVFIMCCLCAISGSNFYQYYNTNKAIDNLPDDTSAQPCLDNTGVIIFTGSYYDLLVNEVATASQPV